MNYKDYQEIKKAEQFEESELVKCYLSEAAKCQKYVKGLIKHDAPQSVIDKQLSKKDEFIWYAIFTGIDEKEQGWKYVEDGAAVLPTLLQQIEDIKENAYLRKKGASGN